MAYEYSSDPLLGRSSTNKPNQFLDQLKAQQAALDAQRLAYQQQVASAPPVEFKVPTYDTPVYPTQPTQPIAQEPPPAAVPTPQSVEAQLTPPAPVAPPPEPKRPTVAEHFANSLRVRGISPTQFQQLPYRERGKLFDEFTNTTEYQDVLTRNLGDSVDLKQRAIAQHRDDLVGQQPERSWSEVVTDPLLALSQGTASAYRGAGGLAAMLGADGAAETLIGLGNQLAGENEQRLSAAQKDINQAFAMARGAKDSLATIAENPSLLVTKPLESVAPMAAGAVGGQAAALAAGGTALAGGAVTGINALSKIGRFLPSLGGAVGEGGMIAGGMAADFAEPDIATIQGARELLSLSEEDAVNAGWTDLPSLREARENARRVIQNGINFSNREKLAIGGAGLFGAAVGAVGNNLSASKGIINVDNVLAQAATAPTTRGRVGNALIGAGIEADQEVTQDAAENLARTFAADGDYAAVDWLGNAVKSAASAAPLGAAGGLATRRAAQVLPGDPNAAALDQEADKAEAEAADQFSAADQTVPANVQQLIDTHNLMVDQNGLPDDHLFQDKPADMDWQDWFISERNRLNAAGADTGFISNVDVGESQPQEGQLILPGVPSPVGVLAQQPPVDPEIAGPEQPSPQLPLPLQDRQGQLNLPGLLDEGLPLPTATDAPVQGAVAKGQFDAFGEDQQRINQVTEPLVKAFGAKRANEILKEAYDVAATQRDVAMYLEDQLARATPRKPTLLVRDKDLNGFVRNLAKQAEGTEYETDVKLMLKSGNLDRAFIDSIANEVPGIKQQQAAAQLKEQQARVQRLADYVNSNPNADTTPVKRAFTAKLVNPKTVDVYAQQAKIPAWVLNGEPNPKSLKPVDPIVARNKRLDDMLNRVKGTALEADIALAKKAGVTDDAVIDNLESQINDALAIANRKDIDSKHERLGILKDYLQNTPSDTNTPIRRALASGMINENTVGIYYNAAKIPKDYADKAAPLVRSKVKKTVAELELQSMVKRLGGIKWVGEGDRMFMHQDYSPRDAKGRVTKYEGIFSLNQKAMPLDMMREAVNQYGFNFETTNDLLDAIDESLRGQKHFTPSGWEVETRRMEQEANDEALARQQFDAEYDDNIPFSKKAKDDTRPGQTIADLQSEISSATGIAASMLNVLLPNVTVTDSVTAKVKSADTQAFYDDATGRVVLLADRIPSGDGFGVLLHELFHKHGRAVLGRDKLNQLQAMVMVWAHEPRKSVEYKIYREALQRAKSARTPDEFLTYAIAEAVRYGQTHRPNPSSIWDFLKNIASSFTTAVRKLLPNYKGKLTYTDLLDIASGMFNVEIKNPDPKVQPTKTKAVKPVTLTASDIAINGNQKSVATGDETGAFIVAMPRPDGKSDLVPVPNLDGVLKLWEQHGFRMDGRTYKTSPTTATGTTRGRGVMNPAYLPNSSRVTLNSYVGKALRGWTKATADYLRQRAVRASDGSINQMVSQHVGDALATWVDSSMNMLDIANVAFNDTLGGMAIIVDKRLGIDPKAEDSLRNRVMGGMSQIAASIQASGTAFGHETVFKMYEDIIDFMRSKGVSKQGIREISEALMTLEVQHKVHDKHGNSVINPNNFEWNGMKGVEAATALLLDPKANPGNVAAEFKDKLHALEVAVSTIEFNTGRITASQLAKRTKQSFYLPAYNIDWDLNSVYAPRARVGLREGSKISDPIQMYMDQIVNRLNAAVKEVGKREMVAEIWRNQDDAGIKHLFDIVSTKITAEFDRDQSDDIVPNKESNQANRIMSANIDGVIYTVYATPAWQSQAIKKYYNNVGWGSKAHQEQSLKAAMAYLGYRKTMNIFTGMVTRLSLAFRIKMEAAWNTALSYGAAISAIGEANFDPKDLNKVGWTHQYALNMWGNAAKSMKGIVSSRWNADSNDFRIAWYNANGGGVHFRNKYDINSALRATAFDVASKKLKYDPADRLIGSNAQETLDNIRGRLTDKWLLASRSLEAADFALSAWSESLRFSSAISYMEYRNGKKPFKNRAELETFAALNPDIVRTAIMGSKEILGNFETSGSSNIGKTTPFFNAFMKGAFDTIPDMMATRHGKETQAAIFMATLVALAVNRDCNKDALGRSSAYQEYTLGRSVPIGCSGYKLPIDPSYNMATSAAYAIHGVATSQLTEREASTLMLASALDTVNPLRVTDSDLQFKGWRQIPHIVFGGVPVVPQLLTGEDSLGRPTKATHMFDSQNKRVTLNDSNSYDYMRGNPWDSDISVRAAKYMFDHIGVDEPPSTYDTLFKMFTGSVMQNQQRLEKNQRRTGDMRAIETLLFKPEVATPNESYIPNQFRMLVDKISRDDKQFDLVNKRPRQLGEYSELERMVKQVNDKLDDPIYPTHDGRKVNFNRLKHERFIASSQGNRDLAARYQNLIDQGNIVRSRYMAEVLLKARGMQK